MRDDEAAIILLGLIVLALFLATPIFTLLLWIKVRRLERERTPAPGTAMDPALTARVFELEQRVAGLAHAPVAGPAVPAAAPIEAAVPLAAQPVEVPVAAPVAPAVSAEPALPVPPVEPAATVAAATPSSEPSPTPVVAPAPARTPFDWENVIGGQWLNRIGLLAVAIGFSYFLKYAIDNDWIGPTGQVTFGLLLGAAILALAPRFQKKGMIYFADGLTGLGAAILYLSLWAGGSYYQLLPLGAAFAAMMVVTAALLAIAAGRGSPRIAVLGLVGGFLTPALVSTGRDAQVELFTYLAGLNAGLIALAWKRNWRVLDLPAFVLTQLYFVTWFDAFYDDTRLVSTTLFGTIFFAEFAVLPAIRSLRTGIVAIEHGVLLFLNAGMFLFALHTMMWPRHTWALTIAVLLLSVAHLLMARAMPDTPGPMTPRLLFAGLALSLATLAIPIRLSDHWITIALALEAGVLMWTGFRAGLWQLRAGAFALFVIVGLRWLVVPIPVTEVLFNARLATAIITAASAGFALWIAGDHRERISQTERTGFIALGIGMNVLLVSALTLEINLWFLPTDDLAFANPDLFLGRSLAISLLWIVYAGVLVAIGASRRNAALRWQGLILLGITTLKVFMFDLSYLRGLYRILSSIALGVVLIVISYLYQRRLAAEKAKEAE